MPPKPGFQHPSSPGFGYRVDLSSSFAYGDIGITTNRLKGGFDGEAYIAPDRYTRILAGHYSVDFYPVGFDTGVVPAYLSSSVVGVPLPGGRINCNAVAAGLPTCPANLHTSQNDASVQDRVEVLSLQKMIYIGGLLPIVISPTYVSEKGAIGGYDDRFLAWDLKNSTYHQVHLRTEQKKSIFVTVPLRRVAKTVRHVDGRSDLEPQYDGRKLHGKQRADLRGDGSTVLCERFDDVLFSAVAFADIRTGRPVFRKHRDVHRRRLAPGRRPPNPRYS